MEIASAVPPAQPQQFQDPLQGKLKTSLQAVPRPLSRQHSSPPCRQYEFSPKAPVSRPLRKQRSRSLHRHHSSPLHRQFHTSLKAPPRPLRRHLQVLCPRHQIRQDLFEGTSRPLHKQVQDILTGNFESSMKPPFRTSLKALSRPLRRHHSSPLCRQLKTSLQSCSRPPRRHLSSPL